MLLDLVWGERGPPPYDSHSTAVGQEVALVVLLVRFWKPCGSQECRFRLRFALLHAEVVAPMLRR